MTKPILNSADQLAYQIVKNIHVVYGAGDIGTREVRARFFEKGIPIEFRDTRDLQGGALVALRRLGHDTIPQVYFPDYGYLGNYEQTMAHLAKLPNRCATNVSA